MVLKFFFNTIANFVFKGSFISLCTVQGNVSIREEKKYRECSIRVVTSLINIIRLAY